MSSDQLIISRLTSGIKKLNTIKIPKEIVNVAKNLIIDISGVCLLYTSPSPRDRTRSRMPSSA